MNLTPTTTSPALETVASIDMQSMVGDYDTPEEIPEWDWIAANASFAHQGNGTEPGVYEFVLNLCRDFDDIPARLASVIADAKGVGAGYLMVYQS